VSGWIIVQGDSYYGPFRTKDAAALWGGRKLGPYTGRAWRIAELWNPKNVD